MLDGTSASPERNFPMYGLFVAGYTACIKTLTHNNSTEGFGERESEAMTKCMDNFVATQGATRWGWQVDTANKQPREADVPDPFED